jgi:CheY-like chemotaxis protein
VEAAQKRRLLASGATAYLTKPFDIGDVLQVIDRTLGMPPPGNDKERWSNRYRN